MLGSFKSAGSSGLGGRVVVAMIRCKDIFVYKKLDSKNDGSMMNFYLSLINIRLVRVYFGNESKKTKGVSLGRCVQHLWLRSSPTARLR